MFLFAKHAAEEKIGVREQLWGVRLFRVGPRQHLVGFQAKNRPLRKTMPRANATFCHERRD